MVVVQACQQMSDSPAEPSAPRSKTKLKLDPCKLLSEDALLKSRVDLWMHQNTLLWNRVITTSAVQSASLAGIYALASNGQRFWSVMLCITAFLLTMGIYRLVFLDLRARLYYRRKLRVEFPGILAPGCPDGFPQGREVFFYILRGFLFVDVAVCVVANIMFWKPANNIALQAVEFLCNGV